MNLPPPKPKLPKPYYQDEWVTIYHGDNRIIAPQLGRFDLLLTDPPYGIKMHSGFGFDGGSIDPKSSKKNGRRYRRQYDSSEWDNKTPDDLSLFLGICKFSIVWGGNFFTHLLPQSNKWLVWDKENTMPNFSDCEIAWTNLPGVSLKKFTVSWKGEKVKYHPTEKHGDLIRWCISISGDIKSVLDPFGGSCTTARACKDLKIKCICIEREEKYCEVGARRMAQEVLL